MAAMTDAEREAFRAQGQTIRARAMASIAAMQATMPAPAPTAKVTPDNSGPAATARQISYLSSLVVRVARISHFEGSLGSGREFAAEMSAEMARGISTRRASQLIGEALRLINQGA